MSALPSSLPLLVRLPAVGSARGESVAAPPPAVNSLPPAATATQSLTIVPANDSAVQVTLVPIDLTKRSGERVNARWFNPRDGEVTRIGDGDWVLVLNDAAKAFPYPDLP